MPQFNSPHQHRILLSSHWNKFCTAVRWYSRQFQRRAASLTSRSCGFPRSSEHVSCAPTYSCSHFYFHDIVQLSSAFRSMCLFICFFFSFLLFSFFPFSCSCFVFPLHFFLVLSLKNNFCSFVKPFSFLHFFPFFSFSCIFSLLNFSFQFSFLSTFAFPSHLLFFLFSFVFLTPVGVSTLFELFCFHFVN